MMHPKSTGHARLRRAAAALLVLGCAVFLAVRSDLTLEAVLARTPQNPLALAAIFLLLYAAKGATMFFPLLVLQAAAGFVFPLPAALAVNFLGMLIDLTVPYVMGRRAGQKLVGTILARYPKLEVFLEKQQDHAFFLNFLLRVFSCLPGDVVTLYFGATGVPLWQNMAGGGLGVLPGMVLGTILGKSLEDPASPAFWVSAGLSVGLAAASTVFYGLYLRRQKRKEGRS